MTAVPPSTQAGMAPAEAGLQGMAAAMRALEQEQVASATTLNAATDSLSGDYPAASAAGGRSKKTAASDKDDGIAPTAWPGEPGEGGVDEDAQALADAAAREPGASAVQSDPFDSFAQLSDPFDKAAAAAADAQIETSMANSALPERAGQFDTVVDATGSPAGLDLARALCRPLGTLVLKSTCAAGTDFKTAMYVVDELKIVGSRCGPFPPALALMASGLDLTPLITATYPLEKAVEAVEKARTKGTMKVQIRVSEEIGETHGVPVE